MDKKIKEQEKEYLDSVVQEIDKVKMRNNKKIKENNQSITLLKKFFSDNYYDIHTGNGQEFGSEDEFANINISIENFQKQNTSLENETRRLSKQKQKPYFGRFDFKCDGEDLNSYYVGLGFIQDSNKNNLVYDWRADICSLYYEDKFGHTSYTCQDGEISGEVTLKRQYKIENGKLLYYIDSNLIIDDDILMEQLSQNATSKMHDIVSTIQKEQNVLIRDNDFVNTIVQGVAGSGKTSVAMHRVSYLLYKYRNQLKSEDILILSPSEMFADYIDDVLPSLGEEKTFTTTFITMAKRLLGQDFQSREELLERIIEYQSQKDFENIAIKSSFEFLDSLKNFLSNDICKLFLPKTMIFGDVIISKEDISDIYFNRLKILPVHKRLDVLAELIVDKFKLPTDKKIDLIKRTKKVLYNKFLTTDLLKIYNLFLTSEELEEVTEIGAYDIAPILLIKENLFGLKNNYNAKYVIVDEMQDYTPCHFYLFEKIWKCAKLYLGDINQSIDRTLATNYLTELAKLTKSQIKHLKKSYRSTLQISLFSQKILGRKIANNVNRQGEEVGFIKTKNCAKAIEEIITKHKQSAKIKNQSMAIICKTESQIELLKKQSEALKKVKILDSTKTTKSKIVFATPAKAKGVEYDNVIIPFANNDTYSNELDKNLLYVSSTRALHKLYIISDKKPSKFLIKNSKK